MAHEDWGEGPWNTEPDHDVWVDELTDLDCMINRGPSGAWCGYVGVGPDHPLHRVEYMDPMVSDIEVHGGLTYSAACEEGGEICHVPWPNREHDIWWFGFDCAHAFDVMPKMDADLRELRKRVPTFTSVLESFDDPRMRSTYKDMAYVIGEVLQLAQQLKAVTGD